MLEQNIFNSQASVSCDDSSLFILSGYSSLGLYQNTNSLVYLSGVNSSYVALNPTDSSEQIMDLYGNRGASSFGLSATLFVAGGVAGVNDIFGFANDPYAQLFVTSDWLGHGLQSVTPDRHGGTLVAFSNGGLMDIVGDSHFGIVSQSGSSYILRNIG